MKQILRFVHLRHLRHLTPLSQVWRAASFGSSSHSLYKSERASDAERPKAPRQDTVQPMLWMVSMHKDLMNQVDLPPVWRGASYYSEEYLKELSTYDLMSHARAIQRVDRGSMKLIQALWRRFDSMTVEEMIATADIFFMNGVHTPWYSSAIISYMTEMFDLLQITPNQFTRLTIHLANHRHVSPYIMNALEQHLCDRLDEFHINEICVIFHSFFLNKVRFKSVVLLDNVATRLLSEFESVNNLYLPILMKNFRLSRYTKVSFYKELGDLMVKHDYFSKSRNLGQMMHVAFTYASLRVHNDEMFLKILEQCLNPRLDRRLKDVTKIIWACGTLLVNTDQHLIAIQKILQEFHFSVENVLRYPDNLAECLLGLSYLNIYPENLLNKLFHPKVVRTLLGFDSQRDKSMHLEFLDHSLAIEHPGYSGHQLTSLDREVIKEQVEPKFSLETDIQYRKSVPRVLTALQAALGADKVICTNVLTHIKVADILLTYDEERKEFLDFPEKYVITASSTSSQQDNHLQRIVIILLSRAQFSNDSRPLGLLHCKLRQLKCLNYKTLLVEPNDARNLIMMDEEHIQKFLLPRISSLISSHHNT